MLVMLLLSLLCGCGLIFDGAMPEQKQEESLDQPEMDVSPLPYTVRFHVITFDGREASGSVESISTDCGTVTDDTNNTSADASTAKASDDAAAQEKTPGDKETAQYLVDRMRELSRLVRLRDELPDGEMGLEMRTRSDVETAIKLMCSEGYYDGTADMNIHVEKDKAHVVITMRPGKIYVVGDIMVNYLPDLLLPERLEDTSETVFPRTTLPGVVPGSPVTAENMLKSVNSIADTLHRNAFPDAKLKDAYFYLDREKHTINAIVDIEPGKPVALGRVRFSGNNTVKSDYLTRLVEWQPDVTLWDQDELEAYVSRLRATGLFHKVSIAMGDTRDIAGGGQARDVNVEVEEGKQRSLIAGLKYSTDSGFGVTAEWEHRNLLGRGEKLALTVPYSETERGIKGEFTRPYIFSRRNTLYLWGEALDETTDAYRRQGVKLNASLKHKWTDSFATEAGPFVDNGYLDNNEHDITDYNVAGLNLKATFDLRDNEKNPTSGMLAEISATPMSGRYDEKFSALGAELHISGYWAPMDNDNLVLAARVGLGAIYGTPLKNLPSTYRYYMGGANTVRGYGYQQIGPMDADDDPIGGRSYQNINLESRFTVTDTMGFVLFLDGGQLYDEDIPQLETDMEWGAGAGIRYFTPIGPLRFDIAFPINNDVDPPLQIYISIGQAF